MTKLSKRRLKAATLQATGKTRLNEFMAVPLWCPISLAPSKSHNPGQGKSVRIKVALDLIAAVGNSGVGVFEAIAG